MHAWVYHTAGRHVEAAALIAQLRASGEFGSVTPSNTRYYNGEIHKGCVVYHDGSRRDLVWAHEREGVELRQFAGQTMDTEARLAPSAPVVEPPPVDPAQVGERVEQAGQWFTAFRNGQKVGKAQRTEDEAWALLGGRPLALKPVAEGAT